MIVHRLRGLLPTPLKRMLSSLGVGRFTRRFDPLRDPSHVWRLPDGTRFRAPREADWQYVTGDYEPHIREAIVASLPRGCTAVDAGAHIGYLSLVMAQTAGRVLAIEPDPENAQILRDNVALNDWAHIDVIEAAIGDKDGTAFLARGRSSFEGRLAAVGAPVRTVTLASIAPDALFVKIDVEGADDRAIAGMGSLLGQATVLVELHDTSGRRALQLLSAAGYLSRWISDRHVLASPER